MKGHLTIVDHGTGQTSSDPPATTPNTPFAQRTTTIFVDDYTVVNFTMCPWGLGRHGYRSGISPDKRFNSERKRGAYMNR